MSLEIGQIVGDYEIIGVIGAGGMGSVYRAKNLISDRVDALKVLLPDLINSAALAERFLNEIKVLASLAHPNIAALHTALRVDNQLIMVMEMVEGTNLDEHLRRGMLPIAEGIAYLDQVLSALSYAHLRGIVHRDIKPANIAVNREGTVKLLDFGIARAAATPSVTRTGTVLGSLFYMSPEQVNGQPADARSDIYSLGVSFYRALTGRRPIDGESEFAVMLAQTNDMPPPPIHWNPALPVGVSDAIMRALAKSPANRFQTAADFRRAIEPFATSMARRAAPEPQDATRTMPQSNPALPQAGTPLPTSNVFPPNALAALQKNLALSLGPIAGAIIRKQARITSTLPGLCAALAEQISAEPERRAFLKACASDLGPEILSELPTGLSAATPAPAAAAPPAWDPAVIERSKKTLADYIGPLAKVMVDRAAKRARSIDELYMILGAEIPSEKDREKFLASRARLFD